jgi:O-antigen ligase
MCTEKRCISTQVRGRGRDTRTIVAREKMQNKNNRVYEQINNAGMAEEKRSQQIPTNPQPLLRPLLNLYISFTKESLIGKLLIFLFLILPWNLGKHFETKFSFIDSLLIPYLIPTVYLQDILIAAIVVLTAVALVKSLLSGNLRSAFLVDAVASRLFFLFILAVFLSVFFSVRFYPSAYAFERFLLYFFFFLSTLNLFRKVSIRRWFFTALTFNACLLCLLGFVQFYKQASVFNNYLFFGEQPYNSYTSYIAKESFNGVVKIPPYATFLHPNIFAGYLLISLTLSLGYIFCAKRHSLWSAFILVLISVFELYFIKSYTAWGALALGFSLLILTRFTKQVDKQRLLLFFTALATVIAGLLLPFYKNQALTFLPAGSVTSVLSVERRSALLEASYKMISQKPFSGWGINSFTYSFESFYSRSDVVRFLQPVHNVYALLAVELGLFGVLLFVTLTFYAIYRSGLVFGIATLQIVFLSSFDHYFITISQTQLLFILTLMLGLTYTEDSDCL